MSRRNRVVPEGGLPRQRRGFLAFLLNLFRSPPAVARVADSDGGRVSDNEVSDNAVARIVAQVVADPTVSSSRHLNQVQQQVSMAELAASAAQARSEFQNQNDNAANFIQKLAAASNGSLKFEQLRQYRYLRGEEAKIFALEFLKQADQGLFNFEALKNLCELVKDCDLDDKKLVINKFLEKAQHHIFKQGESGFEAVKNIANFLKDNEISARDFVAKFFCSVLTKENGFALFCKNEKKKNKLKEFFDFFQALPEKGGEGAGHIDFFIRAIAINPEILKRIKLTDLSKIRPNFSAGFDALAQEYDAKYLEDCFEAACKLFLDVDKERFEQFRVRSAKVQVGWDYLRDFYRPLFFHFAFQFVRDLRKVAGFVAPHVEDRMSKDRRKPAVFVGEYFKNEIAKIKVEGDNFGNLCRNFSKIGSVLSLYQASDDVRSGFVEDFVVAAKEAAKKGQAHHVGVFAESDFSNLTYLTYHSENREEVYEILLRDFLLNGEKPSESCFDEICYNVAKGERYQKIINELLQKAPSYASNAFWAVVFAGEEVENFEQEDSRLKFAQDLFKKIEQKDIATFIRLLDDRKQARHSNSNKLFLVRFVAFLMDKKFVPDSLGKNLALNIAESDFRNNDLIGDALKGARPTQIYKFFKEFCDACCEAGVKDADGNELDSKKLFVDYLSRCGVMFGMQDFLEFGREFDKLDARFPIEEKMELMAGFVARGQLEHGVDASYKAIEEFVRYDSDGKEISKFEHLKRFLQVAHYFRQREDLVTEFLDKNGEDFYNEEGFEVICELERSMPQYNRKEYLYKGKELYFAELFIKRMVSAQKPLSVSIIKKFIEYFRSTNPNPNPNFLVEQILASKHSFDKDDLFAVLREFGVFVESPGPIISLAEGLFEEMPRDFFNQDSFARSMELVRDFYNSNPVYSTTISRLFLDNSGDQILTEANFLQLLQVYKGSVLEIERIISHFSRNLDAICTKEVVKFLLPIRQRCDSRIVDNLLMNRAHKNPQEFLRQDTFALACEFEPLKDIIINAVVASDAGALLDKEVGKNLLALCRNDLSGRLSLLNGQDLERFRTVIRDKIGLLSVRNFFESLSSKAERQKFIRLLTKHGVLSSLEAIDVVKRSHNGLRIFKNMKPSDVFDEDFIRQNFAPSDQRSIDDYSCEDVINYISLVSEGRQFPNLIKESRRAEFGMLNLENGVVIVVDDEFLERANIGQDDLIPLANSLLFAPFKHVKKVIEFLRDKKKLNLNDTKFLDLIYKNLSQILRRDFKLFSQGNDVKSATKEFLDFAVSLMGRNVILRNDKRGVDEFYGHIIALNPELLLGILKQLCSFRDFKLLNHHIGRGFSKAFNLFAQEGGENLPERRFKEVSDLFAFVDKVAYYSDENVLGLSEKRKHLAQFNCPILFNFPEIFEKDLRRVFQFLSPQDQDAMMNVADAGLQSEIINRISGALVSWFENFVNEDLQDMDLQYFTAENLDKLIKKSMAFLKLGCGDNSALIGQRLSVVNNTFLAKNPDLADHIIKKIPSQTGGLSAQLECVSDALMIIFRKKDYKKFLETTKNLARDGSFKLSDAYSNAFREDNNFADYLANDKKLIKDIFISLPLKTRRQEFVKVLMENKVLSNLEAIDLIKTKDFYNESLGGLHQFKTLKPSDVFEESFIRENFVPSDQKNIDQYSCEAIIKYIVFSWGHDSLIQAIKPGHRPKLATIYFEDSSIISSQRKQILQQYKATAKKDRERYPASSLGLALAGKVAAAPTPTAEEIKNLQIKFPDEKYSDQRQEESDKRDREALNGKFGELLQFPEALSPAMRKTIGEFCSQIARVNVGDLSEDSQEKLATVFNSNRNRFFHLLCRAENGVAMFRKEIAPSLKDGCHGNLGSVFSRASNRALIKDEVAAIVYGFYETTVYQELNGDPGRGGDVDHSANYSIFDNDIVANGDLNPYGFVKGLASFTMERERQHFVYPILCEMIGIAPDESKIPCEKIYKAVSAIYEEGDALQAIENFATLKMLERLGIQLIAQDDDLKEYDKDGKLTKDGFYESATDIENFIRDNALILRKNLVVEKKEPVPAAIVGSVGETHAVGDDSANRSV